MSLHHHPYVSSNVLAAGPPGGDRDHASQEKAAAAASFAEAAEVLASLASSVLPIGTGTSAAAVANKRGGNKKDTAEPPPKKRPASHNDSIAAKKKSRATNKSAAPSTPTKQPHSSPKNKNKKLPPGHSSVLVEELPTKRPDQEAPILSAILSDRALDESSRLSLQREVAGIRRRYDDSGDLESLLREARDVDARLKRTGFQVRRDDLLTEPNVSQLPRDHPLLPTLMAMMAAQPPSSVAAALTMSQQPSIPIDESKIAMALLSQQLLLPDIGTSTAEVAVAAERNVPMGLPPLNQFNDQQLHLLRQLRLRQEQEEKVAFTNRAEKASLEAASDATLQREVLNMLLLQKLQQDGNAAERSPLLDQLGPLLLQSATLSQGEQNLLGQQHPQSLILERLLPLLQDTKPSSVANDPFPFLGTSPPGSMSLFDSTGHFQGLEQQMSDADSSLGQERLLLLLRQAHRLRQESQSPTLGSSFPIPPGIVDNTNERLPLLQLLKAQLLAKQQAEQASSEQERVLSILQALQESKQPVPVKPAASEQEQLLALLLKAQKQGQSSLLPSAAAPVQEPRTVAPVAALVQLAQLQASLQQKALEDEAANAAAAHASLFQGLANLVNSNQSVGLGASEALSSHSQQQQVQLLAVLKALQEQQR